ncbi:MAG: RNA polymerase sigma-70 factor (ECF subfamily) [Verrucomicrobiales bacterium]|jgi:RNA polymerase sigma-70 factor (ECF subfamily)
MNATCQTMPAASALKKTVNSGRAKASNPECEPSDAELVLRSQNGDTVAFDELVIRYRGKVYAMIVNMIHNDADAWDLAQDAFVKAWKALPRFEARSNFYTWLYRISHNVTYDWLRKKKVRGDGAEFNDQIQASIEPGAHTAPRPILQPDENAEKSELRLKIEKAIAKLSPDHRTVIVLKEVDGMKYQEIADTVGVSIGTVMSRLFYARKKLQGLLKDSAPQSRQ